MKMFFKLSYLMLLVVSFCVSCTRNNSGSANLHDQLTRDVELACEREKLKTVVTVYEIARFRRPKEGPVSDADKLEIQKLVEGVKEDEELVALAKITRALTMHTSGGEFECRNDVTTQPFEIAFWHSVRLLAKDKSQGNIDRMKRLKKELSIDGGNGYDWSTVVDGIPAP